MIKKIKDIQVHAPKSSVFKCNSSKQTNSTTMPRIP